MPQATEQAYADMQESLDELRADNRRLRIDIRELRSRQTEIDYLREQLHQTEYERDVALQRVADVEALLTNPETAIGTLIERVHAVADALDTLTNDARSGIVPAAELYEWIETQAQELRAVTEE